MRYPIAFTREYIEKTSFQVMITTDFGPVDVTKKEAVRMLDTSEADDVELTVDNANKMVILEYPYQKGDDRGEG